MGGHHASWHRLGLPGSRRSTAGADLSAVAAAAAALALGALPALLRRLHISTAQIGRSHWQQHCTSPGMHLKASTAVGNSLGVASIPGCASVQRRGLNSTIDAKTSVQASRCDAEQLSCQMTDLFLLLCSVAVVQALQTILHSALGAFVLGLHCLLAALQHKKISQESPRLCHSCNGLGKFVRDCSRSCGSFETSSQHT